MLPPSQAFPAAPRTGAPAFSLVELLTVVALLVVLLSFSGPAIRAIAGAGSVRKAISDVADTCELARTYAMTRHTYVRVALAQLPAGGRFATPVTVVVVISPAEGSLASDTAADMGNRERWHLVTRPLILENLCVYDDLQAGMPDTSNDALPSGTDIGSFTRDIPSLGAVTFSSILQFSPSGEAGVLKNEPSRYIRIGFDEPSGSDNTAARRGRNPFILRLSGINGSLTVLRKEDM
ncbi:MAG: hypothetical protein J0I10_23165 [Verrucomicrobia bacterium]|nr:hypothetical protein [Verrucomicrobiota bacterium]